MKISRNIKKSNACNPQLSAASTPNVRKKRLGKYRFPTIDEVPAGYYMSRIMHARDIQTKSGKNAVEVFYKVLPLVYCYQVVNNLTPENPDIKPFFIRQRYPKDSIFYEVFEEAMLEALDADDDYDLKPEDIIGLEEKINLTYTSNTAFGGIKDRIVCSVDDLVTEQDEDIYDEYDDDSYIA